MRIVLVTGTVGVGKTTTGFAVAERAAERGISPAFLDLDQLSRLWPAPVGDPFRDELILTNLRSLVPNYAAAGAAMLVLAVVIETAEQLAELEAAAARSALSVLLSWADQLATWVRRASGVYRSSGCQRSGTAPCSRTVAMPSEQSRWHRWVRSVMPAASP